MSKIDFISEFNQYNLKLADERGTKYIAVMGEFGVIYIYDYDDFDFFARLIITNNKTIRIDVSYCSETNDKGYSVKDDGLPGDIVGYVVGELDSLTRCLVDSING